MNRIFSICLIITFSSKVSAQKDSSTLSEFLLNRNEKPSYKVDAVDSTTYVYKDSTEAWSFLNGEFTKYIKTFPQPISIQYFDEGQLVYEYGKFQLSSELLSPNSLAVNINWIEMGSPRGWLTKSIWFSPQDQLNKHNYNPFESTDIPYSESVFIEFIDVEIRNDSLIYDDFEDDDVQVQYWINYKRNERTSISNYLLMDEELGDFRDQSDTIITHGPQPYYFSFNGSKAVYVYYHEGEYIVGKTKNKVLEKLPLRIRRKLK